MGIDFRHVIKKMGVMILLLHTPAAIKLYAQNTDNRLPAFSSEWTDSEKAKFLYCVSGILDPSRETTLQLSTDSYVCVIFEEKEHWMNLHPKAVGKKENSAKLRKCFAENPLQIKGTPQEFHASYDLCMCRAYGLPSPKQ